MEKLFIVIPAYNEEETIAGIVSQWYPIVEQHNGDGASRLLIIDDGSKDATLSIARQAASDKPLMEVVTKENGGHGPAVLFGYRYALEHKADFVFQTDADGQTDPKDFGAFWEVRAQYDAVFGFREKREDGLYRAFVEKVLCLILRLFFGVSVPDANAPFRLMKKEYLDRYLAEIPENYNLPNVLLTMYGSYFHDRICFRKVHFHLRQGGKSSVSIRRLVRTGWRALKDFYLIKQALQRKQG